MKSFRNDDLLQRTKGFALRIIKLVSALPKGLVPGILGGHLLRAGTSPGANYREAHRSRSQAEFVAKIGDCLKEQHETLYWLELLSESGIVETKKLSALMDECDELLAIFTTINKNAQKP
jgi:four helix bundle protein